MRIQLQPVSTPKLELTLPGKHGQTHVVLERLSELGGAVEQTGHQVRMQSVELRTCAVSGLAWPVKAGRVGLAMPATMTGVAVDATIALGELHGPLVSGNATIGLVDSEGLFMDIAGTRVSCDAHFEKLAAEQLETPGTQGGQVGNASLDILNLRNVEAAQGALVCHVSDLCVAGAQAAWQWQAPDELKSQTAAQRTRMPDMHAHTLTLHDVNLHKEHIDIMVDQIELTSGMSFTRSELFIDELAIDHLTLTIEDLDKLVLGTRISPEPGPQGRLAPWLDLNVFDRLNGKIDLDVTVDAKVPVIGRRVGTHKFRLPIEYGVFDYLRLERGLSLLEDAVLDFTVRNNNLVLCRNLPIIGMRKDLVRWPLNDQELALAKERRLIRLRTLPRFILLGTPDQNQRKDKKSDKERAFQLSGIEVNNIDIALSASADRDTEAESQSAISALAMERCTIQGALRYPRDAPQTVIVRADALSAQLRDLRLGNVTVHRGRVAIDKLVEARVTFAGLRPSALTLTLEGVRIKDAVIAINRQSDTPPREPSR